MNSKIKTNIGYAVVDKGKIDEMEFSRLSIYSRKYEADYFAKPNYEVVKVIIKEAR